MSDATAGWLARVRPRGETLRYGAAVVAAEALLVAGYFAISPSTLVGPGAVRFLIYPFVWINVGIWAILRTTPAPTTLRRRRLAGALAAGYFLVLAYAGGLVAFGHGPVGGIDVSVFSVPPGWGPVLAYSGPFIQLSILPFKLVGYVALAYLVYATTIDAAGTAVGGVLGVLSCVSCTWPVLASLATGLGGANGPAAAVYARSYGLSTVVFVVTVALLYWRPFGR